MRQFAGKAFHFLSDRIFHATEVLPGERAVRPLLSGKFVCYAGPSGFLDVLQPFFSRLLIRLVKQALSLAVCSARYCWLTPGFFHKRCITWSISNVMSTLLFINNLCMVWRKVIRVFRILIISYCYF